MLAGKYLGQSYVGGQSTSTGVLVEYLMTEGSGTTIADSSGNGNTGTLSGGVTWSTDGH